MHSWQHIHRLMAFCVNLKSKPWVWLRILVDWLYWAMRLLSFIVISLQNWVGYVGSKPFFFFHIGAFYYAHLCISPFPPSLSSIFPFCFLYLYRYLSFTFCHLFMCNLPLTRSSVFTKLPCLPPGMHRLDLLSSITWDGLTRMQLVCKVR